MGKPVKEKKLVRYSIETLILPCEWENCTVVEEDIESFISHLTSEHLTSLNEEDLHCHWKDCEGFTENLSELRRHILLHAFHTKIKCYGRNLQVRKSIPNCGLSLHSRNLIPELPDPLACCWEKCSAVFECPEHFYRHADNHADADSRENKTSAVCLWHDCGRTFTDQHKVKEHLRCHTQEKLIACPTCGGMFASRTKFLDHIQRQIAVVDDTVDAYVCAYCSRKMLSERLLRDHMRHHVNHYKCPYCDMTCPTPSGLQSHIAYRHSDNKPHACQYCDYRCKSENDLRKHLESHSMVPTYQCPADGCSYATRSPTCFNVHYRKKHEDKPPAKYSCHLCDKVCTRGNYLTKHLLNHHKFHWPSGHCRFRYRLREDGFYRLQTVRYESLELSETMMCESSENIDDPENLMNSVTENSSKESNSFCSDVSDTLNEHVIHGADASVVGGSLVFCLEDGNKVQFQQSTSVIGSSTAVSGAYLQNSETTQQEVLINILDASDRDCLHDPNGPSVILIKSPQQIENRPTTVQLLSKDATGRMIIETAEVISQSSPSIE